MPLILVPTPIGNLQDVSLRAIEALKSAELVLAEDTRVTQKLFQKYKIENKTQSYHQYNEHGLTPRIIDYLKQNMRIAMVSDAGTPAISDPGYLLVRECISHNIDVECLPGPTAIIPALVVSGIPCDTFCFEGFLPAKKGRNKKLQAITGEKRTMVFYESPHRIVRTLKDLGNCLGSERQASVSREISKMHEETRRGSLGELQAYFSTANVRGEFVLVVAGA